MSTPASRLIQTRTEFQDALRQAFSDIAAAGPREIWMCDADFADWPLNEPQVVDSLARWAIGHRSCTILALDYESIQRRHPRWVQWRRERAHVVRCRIPDEADKLNLPCVLLASGTVSLRLIDRALYRGSVSTEISDAVRDRDRLDALMQRSVDAFPATTLGL
ncbi:MAG: hypothetical protein Q7T97_03090 [Burkholderiaceae bacterium]|nr:hypothetical protein [Burkholderiaceae bacterium]